MLFEGISLSDIDTFQEYYGSVLAQLEAKLAKIPELRLSEL